MAPLEPGSQFAPPRASTLPPPLAPPAAPPALPPQPAAPVPRLPESEQPILVVPPTATPLRPWEVRADRLAARMPANLRDEVTPAHPGRVVRFGPPVAPIGRVTVLVAALAASLGAIVWFVVAALDRRSLMIDIRDGASVDVSIVASADHRLSTAAVLVLVTSLVASVALVAWMHRAYRTTSVWRAPQYSLGWTVFGWIVPLLNLVRPLKIMMEIVEVSAPRGRRPTLVLVWWILWVVPGFAAIGIDQLDPDSASSFARYDSLFAGAAIALGVATLLLAIVAVRATLDQRDHIAETARRP